MKIIKKPFGKLADGGHVHIVIEDDELLIKTRSLKEEAQAVD